MNRVDIDDFTHALAQTVGFFGKELDKAQVALWIRAFSGKEYPPIRAALIEYTKIGRYAPKPRDIIEIMDEQRVATQARLPPPDKQSCHCPQNIADAWAWFIKMHSGHEFGRKTQPTNEQQEIYLNTVNHEAHRLNMPDAIPEEFKLKEVWGIAA